MPVARRSPYSLYREDLATFGEDAVYDQKDAAGFIRLWGLPSEVRARLLAERAAPATDEAEPSKTNGAGIRPAALPG
jgi:hypothetical protein